MEEEVLSAVQLNMALITIALGILAIKLMCLDRKQRVKRKRQMWVKDILSKRFEEETFNLLIPKLLLDDKQFCNFFPMDQESFNFLLGLIQLEPCMTKKYTNWRCPISPSERLALSLRYLATGIIK